MGGKENTMSEHPRSQIHDTQALRRYIKALEGGDLDAISNMLGQAESDPVLEQHIFEINRVYQSRYSIAVERNELAEAQRFLAGFHQSNNGIRHESRLLTVPVDIHATSPEVAQKRKVASKRLLSNPAIHFMQTAAAVFIVGILVIGFVLVFASRHAPLTGSTATGTSKQGIVTVISQGTIYALQPDRGTILWTFATHESHSIEELALDSQAVYAYIQEQGMVYALRASDGQLLWKTHLNIVTGRGDEDTGHIVLDNGILFVNATDLNQGDIIFAVRVTDGALLWHYRTTFSSGLAAGNGVAYVGNIGTGGSNSMLVALRETDGKQLWSYPAMPLSMVVANNVVYVHSAHMSTSAGDSNKEDMSLLALNAEKGTLLWSQQTIDDTPGPLTIENNMLILATAYRFNTYHFCAYRSDTGAQLWCTQNTPTLFLGNPTGFSVMGSTLYVSHVNNANPQSTQLAASTQVAAFSTDTGKLLWTKNLANAANGSIDFLVGMNGTLYTEVGSQFSALSGADGHVLWQTTINGVIAVAASA
jgi:outer membrane protein assembly factor BamB/DNA-binding protein Fis